MFDSINSLIETDFVKFMEEDDWDDSENNVVWWSSMFTRFIEDSGA